MNLKEYKLGNVCQIINGRAYSLPELLSEGKYLVLRVGNIFDGTNWYYSDLELPDNKYCYDGDLLYAWSCNFGPYIWHGDKTIFHYHIWKIIENSTILDRQFLYYYLIAYTDSLKAGIHGSVMMHLTKTDIEAAIIKIPCLESQKKIVSILKSLDDKIENNRKINENLEQQAQALFKSWFVDYEPFRDQPFVESELGMIPEGWRVGTLSEIADINPIRTLKKGQNAMYLDMKNMPTTGSFPIRWEKKDYSGGMKFKNQDTIMARITPCLENGKVAYINFLDDNEIAFGSTEYIVMTTKDGFMPELLYFLCRDKAFKDYATVNMNGSSGRQRVSGDVIGNYKIVIPPKNILEPLSNYYKNVMDKIRNNGFENLHLSQLRDTLLPRLMSGEIEILTNKIL